MAYDGIVAKKVVEELQNIINYKIDKIYQPDTNTIILGLYGNFTNIAMLVSISSNNYRLHLTEHTLKNPDIAPNFCMLLRKHILGYKIAKIYTNALERIIYIELNNSENLDKIIKKYLIIELMGKHSNIILTNENGIIIDAIRHTSTEENAQRDIYPTSRYFEPITKKEDFLKIKNFEEFYEFLNRYNNDNINSIEARKEENICEKITNIFNGVGLSNIMHLSQNEKKQKQYQTEKLEAHQIYNLITKIINSKKLTITTIFNKNYLPKDYFLCISEESQIFNLNYTLDEFYYKKESNEIFLNYRNTLLNIILATLKKYEKRLENIDNKLEECKEMDKYKLYGELITANLYRLPKYNVSEVSLENYYNENNIIKIQMDKKYSPQYNAKRFYKKYNKLKNAQEIVSNQKQETINEIKYIESIIYEIENCNSINDIDSIYNEIEESDIFKQVLSRKKSKKKKKIKAKKLTSNKLATFNPIKLNIDGYTIYVGRNNKENDYLTNKFANKNDIWLHTKDIHGSHVIIKNNTTLEEKNENIQPKNQENFENVPYSIIEEAAKLAIAHSKAKKSSNVPVDYCLVKYVKKISGNKPGLVTYKNNKTIYATAQ